MKLWVKDEVAMQRNILFIGPIDSGKSTLINALLKKNLLVTSILPATAVITKIVTSDLEGVSVFNKNQPEPENISLIEFNEKFRIEPRNENKFKNIDYALLNHKCDNTIRDLAIIDTPGLEYSEIKNEISRNYLPSADVVVYVVNGIRSWTFEEREYICNEFANKQMDNVFFIITHADQLHREDLSQIKEHFKDTFHDVFVDIHGVFNEEIFQQRVFLLNGYGALCARSGTSDKVNQSIKEEETGIIEFQDALSHYLDGSVTNESSSSLPIRRSQFMNANMNDSQQLLDQTTSLLEGYQAMIGSKDPSVEARYGFVPGLEMPEEAKMLGKKIEEMKQGLFQVLFIGPFNAGKSTLINALLAKDLLKSKMTPETAIITKIVFGDHEGVKVFKKFLPEPEDYSVNTFFEKYSVEEGNETKFQDIDYAIISQKSDAFDRTIQLVDSPGLQNTLTENKIAKEFAQRADAIVFLTHGTMAWSFEEKEYISRNFANKHLDNVFFVVTYADQIPEGEITDFDKHNREVLHDVFIDKNNNFDEAKYQRRVFCLNGWGALCARTRTPYKIGRITVPIKEEDTGILEFQNALYEFLSSEDKDKKALAGFVGQLENIQNTAKTKIDNILHTYSQNKKQTEEERDRYQKAIIELETIIQNINTACQTTAKNIALNASGEYDSFVTRVDTEWDSYFNKMDIDFGFEKLFELVKINLSRDTNKEEKQKELAKPITDAVQCYIEGQSTILSESLADNISHQITDLSELLEKYVKQIDNLDINVDDILAQICQAFEIDYSALGAGKINIGQVLVAVLLTGDPEAVVKGLTGGTPWIEFIKEAVVTTVVEIILAYLVSFIFGVGWIYLVIRGIIAVFQIAKQGGGIAEKCISNSKQKTIESLKNGAITFKNEIEEKFGHGLVERTTTATDFIFEKVKENKNVLDSVLDNLENQNFNLEGEKKRFTAITNKMQETLIEYRAAVE
jgi:GTPase Era involved in 16S rRNA processing